MVLNFLSPIDFWLREVLLRGHLFLLAINKIGYCFQSVPTPNSQHYYYNTFCVICQEVFEKNSQLFFSGVCDHSPIPSFTAVCRLLSTFLSATFITNKQTRYCSPINSLSLFSRLPLDIIIISHLVLFVKHFLKKSLLSF